MFSSQRTSRITPDITVPTMTVEMGLSVPLTRIAFGLMSAAAGFAPDALPDTKSQTPMATMIAAVIKMTTLPTRCGRCGRPYLSCTSWSCTSCAPITIALDRNSARREETHSAGRIFREIEPRLTTIALAHGARQLVRKRYRTERRRWDLSPGYPDFRHIFSLTSG